MYNNANEGIKKSGEPGSRRHICKKINYNNGKKTMVEKIKEKKI